MNKIHRILIITLLTLSCSSFMQHRWQHEARPSTTDILEQFYPDQNAYRLQSQIPNDLKGLSYGIYPFSCGYDTSRFNYNKRFNVFPHVIFTPRTENEIKYVLKMLKKHSKKFAIRSGGHCIEPGSLSSGYIIDLRNFHLIKPDLKKQEVRIGAGVKLGTVIKTLGKLGYAIPTGTCSSVGVTGLSMGGGLGVLGRVFGLTCDSIKSIRLLTANGKIINVTKKSHPDLFWALCGAGNGSYGIALEFTFNIHRVSCVSTLKLSWKWERRTVFKVINAWQKWIKNLPDTITTQLHLKYLNNTLSIEVTGLKVGKESFTEWKKAFNHLKPEVKIKKESYLKSAHEWADRSPYPFFKSKSEMLFKPLSHKPIDFAINFFEKLKHNNTKYYAFFELEAMGGAIKRNKNSFFPRKAFAWWYQVMYWDQEKFANGALHALRKFKSDIAPYVSPYSYANIVDYEIGKDYLKVYYGDHVNRLIKIKRKYDHEDIFHWRQSIPLAHK